MRLWVLKECYLYEATQFALRIVNNDEQRNTQRKGYVDKRLAFYTDLLYQATDSFYMLKQLFCYILKKHNTTTTPTKNPNPTTLQGQGLATFLQSLSKPDHKLIWREFFPEESA